MRCTDSPAFSKRACGSAVRPALMRAMQLLTELADAKVTGVVETGKNKLDDIEITLRFPQVKRILGCSIEPQKCITILEHLGFKKLGSNEAAAKFLVPSWRAYDVTREIDLIEEIARINGYDKIAPTLPSKTQLPEITQEEKVLSKLHNLMRSNGLNEIITSSLTGKTMQDKYMISFNKENAVYVENPASEDYSMLRQSMAASVLNVMKMNFDNGQKSFWAYEIGKTYEIISPADEKFSGVKESKVLAGILTGEIENSKWQKTGELDFYTVKGIFEQLFKEKAKGISFKDSALHTEFAEELIDKYKNNIKNNIKGHKQFTGLIISLAVLPITCTLLNWVYPRFMDAVFPNLSNKKHDNESKQLVDKAPKEQTGGVAA